MDDHGAIRVGNSRVLLDVIVGDYERGETAEAIAVGYDTVTLAEVYAVLAYYHRHRQEVQAYLARREREAEEIRRKVEAIQPPRPGFREELLARMEKGRATPGQ
jgi:uncharacterized protein (DUF433 family)